MRQVFYGWIIVVCVFLITLIGFGTAYSFAAFLPSLQSEFGATRGMVSIIFSLSGFLYFGLGVLSGPLADRLGPRWIVAAGMLLLGAGLFLASRATSLWQVTLAYSLGVGMGVGFAYVPSIGAVQRWFLVRRGLATGLAVAGIGVGTLTMPLLAGWLIRLLGWRDAYVVLATIAVVLGVAIALQIEHSPQRRGLRPDGAPVLQPEAAGSTYAGRSAEANNDGPTIRQALKSRPFWLIYVGSFLASVGLYIPFVHLPAYAQDHGIAQPLSLLLLSLIGIGSIVGRFGMAGLADRWGRRQTLAGTYSAMAVLLVFWFVSTSVWSLGAFALLFGASYGAYVALFPAISADYFAGSNSTGIFGFLVTNLAFGTLLGPAAAGVAFDLTGSYTVPILASAVCSAISVGCMLLASDPDSWRDHHLTGLIRVATQPVQETEDAPSHKMGADGYPELTESPRHG